MKNAVFLFSGQGSQYVGMGEKLNNSFKTAARIFEEANDILEFDLRSICFNGSQDMLTKTENTQPAILTVSVAQFKVYMEEFGHEPMYLAGHSLGEISALVCAGGIRFSDALKIVRSRGVFMQAAVPEGIGAMAAVSGIDSSYIEQVCKGLTLEDEAAVISNYNSPDQTVISGHKAAVEKLSQILTGAGGRVIPLKVSAPFHSPLMEPASVRLNEELNKYTYYPMKYPVISNVDALPYKNHNCIVENLSKQVVMPVQWVLTMNYLQSRKVDTAIEFGPAEVLKKLTKKNIDGINAFSFDNAADIDRLKSELHKSLPHKAAKRRLMERCLAIAVCTPNSNWNNDEYSKGVIEPYKSIQQLVDKLEREGIDPSFEQMQQALDMLRSVFATKRTSIDEQVERFNQLFDETGTRNIFETFKMPE